MQIAFGLAGQWVGGTLFGSAIAGKVGYLIGSALGASLFGEDTNTQSFGPRLEDLNVTSSVDGSDMPIVWGTARIAGNIIWALPIHEVSNTVTQSSGGKGGSSQSSSQTTYSYFATFALSLGEFTNSSVRRIWMNKKVVYDARVDAETVSFESLSFTLYDGNQTTADPDIETDLGVGNAPAYTGETYIVFDTLPLAEFGNAVPQIEVEVVVNGTTTNPNNRVTLSDPMTTFIDFAERFYTIDDYVLYACGNGSTVYDTVFYFVDPNDLTNNGWTKLDLIGLVPNASSMASAWVFKQVDKYYIIVSGDGSYTAEIDFVQKTLKNFRVAAGDYPQYIYDSPSPDFIIGAKYSTGIMVYETVDIGLSDPSWTVYDMPEPYYTDWRLFNIQSGETALIVPYADGTSMVLIQNIADNNILKPYYFAANLSSWSLGANAWPIADYKLPTQRYFTTDADTELAWIVANDQVNDYKWLLSFDKEFNLIDEIDLSSYSIELKIGTLITSQFIIADSLTYGKVAYLPKSIPVGNPGHINHGIYEVVLSSGQVNFYEFTNCEGGSINENYYNKNTNTLISGLMGNPTTFFDYISFNRVDPSSILLSDIVTDIVEDVGIDNSSVDLTEVTQIVRGYRHTRRTSARSDLEPLLTAFAIDAVQSGWTLKFKPRGGSVVKTITSDELGYAQDLGNVFATVENFAQGLDIPKSINIQYLSSDNDYQISDAQAIFDTTGYERLASASFPIVFSDQEAAELADRLLMEITSLRGLEFSLNYSNVGLDPTDVIEIPVNGVLIRARLLKTDYGKNRIIKCAAVEDDPNYLISVLDGAGSPWVNAVVDTLYRSIPLYIDTPLLRDVDYDQPGAYFLPLPVNGFSASQVFISHDSINYSQFGGFASQSVYGFIPDTSSFTDVDFEDWDDTNTITVTLENGTLSSTTDASALTGSNAALIGNEGRWEVINFVTATLISGTTYELTRLLRGRRGTDNNIGLHQDNDIFMLLDESLIVRNTVSNADIGLTKSYKIVPNGGYIDNYPIYRKIVGNNPLKPYSASNPAYTRLSDIIITWDRRTRKGGSTGGPNSITDNVGGTLSEDTESYEVDIYSKNNIYLRTYTSSTTTVTYTSADQITDGVIPLDRVYVYIYQISAVVGRGFARELIVSGTLDIIQDTNTIKIQDLMTADGAEFIWLLEEAEGSSAGIDEQSNNSFDYVGNKVDGAPLANWSSIATTLSSGKYLTSNTQYTVNDANSVFSFEFLFKSTTSGPLAVLTSDATTVATSFDKFFSLGISGGLFFGTNYSSTNVWTSTPSKNGYNDGLIHHAVLIATDDGSSLFRIRIIVDAETIVDDSAHPVGENATSRYWHVGIGHSNWEDTPEGTGLTYFDGDVDDVAYYNGINLTVEQINQHYTAVFAYLDYIASRSGTTLLDYWPLDDNEPISDGSTVTAYGEGNNITVQGDPDFSVAGGCIFENNRTVASLTSSSCLYVFHLLAQSSLPSSYQSIGDGTAFSVVFAFRKNSDTAGAPQYWYFPKTILDFRVNNSTSVGRVPIEIGMSDGRLGVGKTKARTSQAETKLSRTKNLDDNEWHVAGVLIDTNDMYLFVDNEIEPVQTFTTAIGDTSLNTGYNVSISIGCGTDDAGTPGNFFAGDISNFSISSGTTTLKELNVLSDKFRTQAVIDDYIRAIDLFSVSAHYPLSETTGTKIYDRSGNRHDLILSGNYNLNQASVAAASASLEFLGTADFARGYNKQGLQITGDLTINAWINMNNVTGTFEMVVCENAGGSRPDSNVLYKFGIKNGLLWAYWEDGASGTTDYTASHTALAINTNYMVSLKRDSTGKNIYFLINGVQVDTTTYTNDPDGGTDSLLTLSSSANSVDGNMQHVTIGDSLIATADLLTIYTDFA